MHIKKNRGWLLGILIALTAVIIGFALFMNRDSIQINKDMAGKLVLYVIVIGFIVILVRHMMQSSSGGSKYKVITSTNVHFEQIAGMDEVKKEVQIYIDIMKNFDQYKEAGVRVPKGIILEGSPGNGKTLLAKAIAAEMNVAFIQVNASDIGGILVGKGSQELKKIFAKARTMKPCILFLDEIDAIGGKRVDNGSTANSDSNRIVTSLLTELDGFEGNEGIFVIAATNRIDSLDGALVRPGRFDRKITIKNPDYQTRYQLITMYTKDKKLSSDIDFDELSWKFSGMCCADIENCINTAAIHAISHNRSVLEAKDFEQIIVQQKIKGYLLEEEETICQRELTAYHEAGHAVAAHLLTKDVIALISIVPTTSHVKGFTMSYSKNDRSLLALQEIKNRICILLAGRAAEYLYLGEQEEAITTGCSDDLQKAVSLMKGYLKTSTKGISYNHEDEKLLPPSFHEDLENLSATLWETTVSFCRENWDTLSTVAETLIDKKWITKEELEGLLACPDKIA